MNSMMVLVSLCLLCGGIGLCVGVARRGRLRFAVAPVAVLALLLGSLSLGAQEVVHARAGKVIQVDAAQKTLSLKLADGSTMSFHQVASHEPALSLDKSVREKTLPAATFSKVGANVVVLYYGYDSPTAIAIKELGADAPKKSIGSVSSFDRHERSLTLKTDAAAPQKLVLTDDTIVDTSDGVIKAADYKPSKGEHLRCFTSPNSETALFVAQQ
jgi:hypothetical protein